MLFLASFFSPGARSDINLRDWLIRAFRTSSALLLPLPSPMEAHRSSS